MLWLPLFRCIRLMAATGAAERSMRAADDDCRAAATPFSYAALIFFHDISLR